MVKNGRLLIYGYLLNIYDLIATLILYTRFGIGIEGNPLGRFLLANPMLAIGYKVIGIGALMFLLYRLRERRLAVYGTYAVFFAYLILGAYHAAIQLAIM